MLTNRFSRTLLVVCTKDGSIDALHYSYFRSHFDSIKVVAEFDDKWNEYLNPKLYDFVLYLSTDAAFNLQQVASMERLLEEGLLNVNVCYPLFFGATRNSLVEELITQDSSEFFPPTSRIQNFPVMLIRTTLFGFTEVASLTLDEALSHLRAIGMRSCIDTSSLAYLNHSISKIWLYDSDFYTTRKAIFKLDKNRRKRTITLDATGLQPHFNGTTIHISKLLVQILGITSEYRILVLANPKALKFHGINLRSWKHVVLIENIELLEMSDHTFILNQPFSELHVRQLSNCTLSISALILDIIYIDIDLFSDKRDEIECFWAKLNLYLDHFFFISPFTRDMFMNRFGRPKSFSLLPPSMNPTDYKSTNPREMPPRVGQVLVAGNDFPHKSVVVTADYLMRNFSSLNVIRLDSSGGKGWLPEDKIMSLYSTSKVIIFPSLYEGFGLPIMECIGSGKICFLPFTELNLWWSENFDANVRIYRSLEDLKLQLEEIVFLEIDELPVVDIPWQSWESRAFTAIEIISDIIDQSTPAKLV